MCLNTLKNTTIENNFTQRSVTKHLNRREVKMVA
jgi:hypothetical protein